MTDIIKFAETKNKDLLIAAGMKLKDSYAKSQAYKDFIKISFIIIVKKYLKNNLKRKRKITHSIYQQKKIIYLFC